MQSRSLVHALALGSLLAPSLAIACSSCDCTLNSDWASQGFTSDEGLRLEARYDYFDQLQLRSGTHKFDRSAAAIPNEAELQQSTLNRNLTLGLDYSFQRNWGVNLQLPVVDRPHSTIAPGDDEISRSRSRGLGDVRLLARYLDAERESSVGVQLGVKLPTGRTNYTFTDGPQRGEALDRGLQPGTGTTDILMGVYHFGGLTENTSYFANAIAQLPLNSKDGFRPGAGLNINLGIRYLSESGVVPHLQINARAERRESGTNADIANSGATRVNLSPGISMRLGEQTQLYGFIQVPLYQRVNGLQIEPRYNLSIGLRRAI